MPPPRTRLARFLYGVRAYVEFARELLERIRSLPDA